MMQLNKNALQFTFILNTISI